MYGKPIILCFYLISNCIIQHRQEKGDTTDIILCKCNPLSSSQRPFTNILCFLYMRQIKQISSAEIIPITSSIVWQIRCIRLFQNIVFYGTKLYSKHIEIKIKIKFAATLLYCYSEYTFYLSGYVDIIFEWNYFSSFEQLLRSFISMHP